MTQPTDQPASSSSGRSLVGFRAYVAVRTRGVTIPELAKALRIRATEISAVFAGAGEASDSTVAKLVEHLSPEIDGVPEPETGPGHAPSAGNLSVRQRQLIGWRLYLHLKAGTLTRKELAGRAGVVERTLDRVLTIDRHVAFDTIGRIVSAAGLDLGAMVAWPPRDTALTTRPPGAPRPSAQPSRARGGPLALGLLGCVVAGLAGLFWHANGCSKGSARAMTLHAPIRATTNAATVFGRLPRSSSPTTVVLYVRPESDRDYYRQWARPFLDQSRYQAAIRLGDEAMAEPTQLFRVVAAAVAMGHEETLPGTFAEPRVVADSEEEFLRRIGAVATAVSDVVHVTRVAATPEVEEVRLLSPASGSRVESPFSIVWDPGEQPLYLELRADAREVRPVSGPGRRSGESVDLPAGLYELKLRRSPLDPILASCWFEVISSR